MEPSRDAPAPPSTDAADNRRWVWAILLAGAGYLTIGRVFAWPTTHVEAWRWAAWIVSLFVFSAHFAYEFVNRGSSPRTTALHTALGVALGALAIAVAGMLYTLSTTGTLKATWLIALFAFPGVVAVPAFFVALVAGRVLRRFQPPMLH